MIQRFCDPQAGDSLRVFHFQGVHVDYRRRENQLISMIDRRKDKQVKEEVRKEREVRSWADRTYLTLNDRYAEARG